MRWGGKKNRTAKDFTHDHGDEDDREKRFSNESPWCWCAGKMRKIFPSLRVALIHIFPSLTQVDLILGKNEQNLDFSRLSWGASKSSTTHSTGTLFTKICRDKNSRATGTRNHNYYSCNVFEKQESTPRGGHEAENISDLRIGIKVFCSKMRRRRQTNRMDLILCRVRLDGKR
jgi:hypothetical protein